MDYFDHEDGSVYERTKILLWDCLPIVIVVAGIVIFFIIPLAFFCEWLDKGFCK